MKAKVAKAKAIWLLTEVLPSCNRVYRNDLDMLGCSMFYCVFQGFLFWLEGSIVGP